MTAPDWREAACHRADRALFFAAEDETAERCERRERQAKAVCAGCKIITACLDYRLSFQEQRDGGIWAGLNEDERRAERRRRVRAASARRAA